MVVLTTRGPMDERDLDRTLIVEDNPTAFVVRLEWRERDGQELVGQLTLRTPDGTRTPSHGLIGTMFGDMDAGTLRRRVVTSDLGDEINIVVDWFAESGELVRKDAHVVKTVVSEAMSAIAAAMH